MLLSLPKPLATVVGVLLCAASAAVAATLFVDRPSHVIVPLAFVVVVVLLAMRYGSGVGIYGSLISAFIFAYFLYPPLHSFRVENGTARANLGWMVLAGVALSYLLARPPRALSGKPAKKD
jgi:K+-sensing histidine kinase KdpD